MSEHTHISWADHTHNHWLGCTKISNGPQGACEGCYAKVLVEDRFGRAEFGGPGKGVGTRALTSEANRRKPLAWDRKAAKDGTRPFVFCSSLADVFDSDVPPAWRRELLMLVHATPNLVWLLLTKRPGNIVKLAHQALRIGDVESAWPRNAAIGCTVVTQAEANRDIPKLLAAKAAIEPAFAFLSMEPLMGAVDLDHILVQRATGRGPDVTFSALRGWYGAGANERVGLDWIITGGETDQGSHKARPSNPQWFRDIRDQCLAAGVPYHHKQNGEWEPGECFSRPQTRTQQVADWNGDGWLYSDVTPASADMLTYEDEPTVWRLRRVVRP